MQKIGTGKCLNIKQLIGLANTIVAEHRPVSVLAKVGTVRKHSEVVFAHVNDGTIVNGLQLILSKGIGKNLRGGDVGRFQGHIEVSKGRGQKYDMIVTEIDKLFHRRDMGRHPGASSMSQWTSTEHHAIWRLREGVCEGLRQACRKVLDALEVSAPTLTSVDCESDGETVLVAEPEYFGLNSSSLSLTASSQLHLEAMVCSICRPVFAISRTFRAHPSVSRHHLAEFDMMEIEAPDVPTLDDLLTVTEDIIRETLGYVANSCFEDIRMLKKSSMSGPSALNTDNSNFKLPSKFHRITHNDLVSKLCKRQDDGAMPLVLSRKHELTATELFGNEPLFVTHFPSSQKPYYMKRDPGDQEVALCFDLLLPGSGEVAGGSVRENDHSRLLERTPRNLDWYVDLRSDAYPDLAGFGLGIERLILAMTGLRNASFTIPFPRWKGYCRM